MKKLVLKLDLHDRKDKKKAMSKVSGIEGVVSVAIDMKEMKMTVTGDVDAVEVASKLRKLCGAEIVTVGEDKQPAPEKKDEGGKKASGGGDKKTIDVAELERAYMLYNPRIYHPLTSIEENPNACVIC